MPNKDYSLLPSSESSDVKIQPASSDRFPRLRNILYFGGLIIIWVTTLGLSYLFGVYRERPGSLAVFKPTGDLHYYMHFDGSFAQGSSPESDSLWDSLFPEKLGFVKHPELAPDVAGIAVFHELHCLNMLRIAFFASTDGTLQEIASQDHDANHRASLHHIRHCFEYLRQSLMCLSDANLENMNYTTQGVSGWQTERTCRDFEGLKSWANEWGISREDALRENALSEDSSSA
ncbi:hypothetical protein GGR51DRAFT_378557 [Nemania sp. FL0031]|nr:hypothetical protein GGR51DRAFT_378557 [Nemania sp. FL0031]